MAPASEAQAKELAPHKRSAILSRICYTLSIGSKSVAQKTHVLTTSSREAQLLLGISNSHVSRCKMLFSPAVAGVRWPKRPFVVSKMRRRGDIYAEGSAMAFEL